MDWFKVKVRYSLFSNFTAKEGWAYIQLMALTATLEGIPTKKQMLQICSQIILDRIENVLKLEQNCLENVLKKVEKDTKNVQKTRDKWKRVKLEQREKHENVQVDISVQNKNIDKNKSKIILSNTGEGRFAPPTYLEVNTYCLERKNKVDPMKFIDFYESKGWMVGKNKMKDWKACIRTWEHDTKNNQKVIEPQYKTFEPVKHDRTTYEMPQEVKDMVAKIGNTMPKIEPIPRGIKRF